jgi:hypothetical protein
MTAALLERSQKWECPNCTFVDVTTEANPHSRFHSCAGLKGLTAPMVPAGTRCKIEAVEREDVIGDEVVQTDADGRPIMALITTREDGQDCTVFAPLAVGSLRG